MKGKFLAKLKQSISALLALVLALSLVPMAVLAAEGTPDWSVVPAEAGETEIKAKEDGTATFKFKAKPSDADSKTYYIFDKADTNEYYDFAAVTGTTVKLLANEDGKKTANVSNIKLENDVFTATLIDKTQDATLSIGLYDENHADFTIKAYVAAHKVTFVLTDAAGVELKAGDTLSGTGNEYSAQDGKDATFTLDASKVTDKTKILTVTAKGTAADAKEEVLLPSDTGVYTLEKVAADVTVTVALKAPPAAQKPDESGKVETTVKADDAVTLETLVATTDKTAADAGAVKVEPADAAAGAEKTLVFKDNGATSNSVTLPADLAKKLGEEGGEAQAAVKVDTTEGSVTVPSNAIGFTKDPVSISVEKMDEAKKTVADAKLPENVVKDSAQKTALTDAIKAAKGLSVSVLSGKTNMFDGSGKKEVTISITVGKGSFYVLCTSGDKVTSFGKKTADDKTGTITFTTNHLSDFVTVAEPADATAPLAKALAAIAGDPSAAEPENENLKIEAAASEFNRLPALKVSGMKNGYVYAIVFSNNKSGTTDTKTSVFVYEATKEGDTYTITCNQGLTVSVLEFKDKSGLNPTGTGQATLEPITVVKFGPTTA